MKTFSVYRSAGWALVAVLCFAGLSPTAGAEEGARMVEEVVVTARRQDETLQDVPVTITSVGGEQLEIYQIDQLDEVAARVPNFNIQAGGSGSGGTMNLRGVGSSAISAAFDSAVALDLDGVLVNRMRMVQSAFLDIQQVDILKGPQSLYFGKSATAGVVSFRSADPGDSFEAKVGAGYDFEMDGTYVEGFVSGPITETFGARLAARWAQNNEIWKNEAPGRSEDYDEEDLMARLTLTWNPSDNLYFNWKTTYTDHEAYDGIGQIDQECIVPGDPQESSFPGGALLLPPGYDCDDDDGVMQLGGHNEFVRQNMAGNVNMEPTEELETWLSRLHIDWDINEHLTLTSVTGYFDLDEFGGASYGYDLNGIGSNFTVNKTESWSQELRLAGDINDNASFLLGVYYQDRELIFDTAQEAVGGSYLASLLMLPTIDPTTGFSDDWHKIHTTDSETWSVFGSVTFRPAERWEVTAGLRYSEDERTNTIEVPSIFYLFQPPAFVPAGFDSGDIEFDDDNLSPEVSVLWEATDDINLYAAYKTGYKSGGIDNSALPSASLAVAADTGDFSELIYDSEEAEGFELGMKSSFLDGSLRLDMTLFRYVYDDLQVQTFNSTSIQFSTTNAGEMTSQGFEADFTWLPEVDGLTVYGALSLLDAEFSDTFIPEPGVPEDDPAYDEYDLDGRAVSGAADFAFNTGFDWALPLGNAMEWGFGMNVTYSDKYETQNEDPVGHVQDSYWLLNGHAYIGSADGIWKVSAMGRNITDELYVITSGGRPYADPSNNAILPGGVGANDRVLNYARGRQLFLQFEYRFQ